MKVIKSIPEMRSWSNTLRSDNKVIGLVPTMGFLHEGHLSLIRKAKEKADYIVVSTYVNPMQFAQGEDYDEYPRDFSRDEKLCENEGVAAVFYPHDTAMYPQNYKTYVVTEELDQVLCGRSRPTHFKGVTTICCKLFNIVKPNFAVFGQKDAQQTILIKHMVNDLNMDVEIVVSPIVREPDGLAMSSRNKYLNSKERQEATKIYKSLQLGKIEIETKKLSFDEIKLNMRKYIEEGTSGKIDYIEMVDANTLEIAESNTKEVLIAAAVYFQKTRLIDNIIVKKTI